jgi:ribosomal protein L17
MTQEIRAALTDVRSQDSGAQNKAYTDLIALTSQEVDWAYEAWDELLEGLQHKDNHVRAICAQVLCNLAKSDPKKRMLRDVDALITVTKDERFVTARHCLQSLWKVGVVEPEQRKKLVDGLAARFRECPSEKNGTLIRFDIAQGLRRLYDEVKDEQVRRTALELIETETDLKYRKKYAAVWKIKG